MFIEYRHPNRKTWIFSAYEIYFQIYEVSKQSKAAKSLLFTHSELQHKEYQYNQNGGVIISSENTEEFWKIVTFTFVLEYKLIYSVIKRKAKF